MNGWVNGWVGYLLPIFWIFSEDKSALGGLEIEDGLEELECSLLHVVELGIENAGVVAWMVWVGGWVDEIGGGKKRDNIGWCA